MNSPEIVPFGEIVASTLIHWTIQCWQIGSCAPFGSLVNVSYKENVYLGIINTIETQPKDSHRVPHAFGKTQQELKQEHPQIQLLLKTIATCIPLAYKETAGRMVYEIPQMPPDIHSFASGCNQHDMQIFFREPSWMITFFNLLEQNPLFDELLIAIVRNGYAHHAIDAKTIKEIIDIFSLLTHSDYRKLKIFLQRIEPFIK